MYVQIYVYIYIYIYICIHMCVYIYIYIYIYTSPVDSMRAVRSQMHKAVLFCTHVCVYIYIYIYTHTYTYIHTYIYIYTHTYIHIYIYLWFHDQVGVDYKLDALSREPRLDRALPSVDTPPWIAPSHGPCLFNAPHQCALLQIPLVATASRRSESWGNTNRVVSNRVVSKGPLYPSKTKTILCFLFFDTTPFVCL